MRNVRSAGRIHAKKRVECLQHVQRIDVDPIDLDTPMQVRPADSPGGAGKSNYLALFDQPARGDVDTAQMSVGGEQPAAVVENNDVARIKRSFARPTMPVLAA